MSNYDLENGELFRETIPGEGAGVRLDAYLAETLSGQSRSFIKKLISDGLVEVDGASVKASMKLKGGEVVSVFLPELVELEAKSEDIPLNILYEDSELIVINKNPGIVVHPSPGHETGSLVNGLLFHCKDLSGIGGVLRPGIVHRLDRDTSGVMVAAKTDAAHQHLARQFAERTTVKIYLAITHGRPDPDTGKIETLIGRHPRHRQIMGVLDKGGRESLTWYEAQETHGKFSLIQCRLGTGRTHQIRVHMQHIGCPIICDTFYGREEKLTRSQLLQRGSSQAKAEDDEVIIDRQALHAWQLEFSHPVTDERLRFEAPLPADMESALRTLRKFSA